MALVSEGEGFGGKGVKNISPAQKEILEDDLGKVCNQINEAYKALVPLIEDCNNANGVVNDILNTLQTQGKNPVKVFEFFRSLRVFPLVRICDAGLNE
jgi:hypothetical protein